MASSDYMEVVIKPDIQEVEIESIPVDMPCETVETTIDYGEGQPMVALQPLPEPGREEIILQTQEEIVCSEDPLSSVYDQMQVPDQEIYVETSPGPSRKGGRKGKRGSGGRFKGDNFLSDGHGTETKARKWEQKQVQIKTLEGEFSVTMWASGTDDGKFPERKWTESPARGRGIGFRPCQVGVALSSRAVIWPGASRCASS